MSPWEILTHQPIGLLVQAPVPGMIWPSKVDLGSSDRRNLCMTQEFEPVIKSDRLAATLHLLEPLDDCRGDFLLTLSADLVEKS